jgi:hypothetical protein
VPHPDLASAVREIVLDEYQRRLTSMPREYALELYRAYYVAEADANKGWFLGELVGVTRLES